MNKGKFSSTSRLTFGYVRLLRCVLTSGHSSSAVLGCQGNTSKKIRANTRAPNNHGFDDDRGDYKLVMRDHLVYVAA